MFHNPRGGSLPCILLLYRLFRVGIIRRWNMVFLEMHVLLLREASMQKGGSSMPSQPWHLCIAGIGGGITVQVRVTSEGYIT